jgi:hypothetical protein
MRCSRGSVGNRKAIRGKVNEIQRQTSTTFAPEQATEQPANKTKPETSMISAEGFGSVQARQDWSKWGREKAKWRNEPSGKNPMVSM